MLILVVFKNSAKIIKKIFKFLTIIILKKLIY